MVNEIHFPFAAPEPGARLRLRSGIDWIKLPLPFALNHVNCWWLGEGHDTCLVDTCIDSESSRQRWQTLLAETGLPRQLLVTHFHPDHMGLAGWFKAQGVDLIGSSVEVDIARTIWHTKAPSYAEKYASWYRENGVAEELVEPLHKRGNTYRHIVHEPPEDWRTIVAGDSIELGGKTWTVLSGRGHAPDMLMLYSADDNMLIAADQVLPSISPNISLQPLLKDDNPLQSFLDSLDAFRDLPMDTLVLPSHGLPFTGLHLRLDALAEHHAQRCDDILAACAQPQTGASLFPVLFKRELDAQQLSFALGESLAHLRYLERAGSIRMEVIDNVHVFSLS